MKISIIIPVYNAEQYLRQCLESAIAQTIEEKEIICINDGSEDKTEDILKEFAGRYVFFHYYNQSNQGAGIARNLGLRKAKGEFVAFLDADDFYVDASALEKMYVVCKKNNVEICGSFLSKFIMNEIIPMGLHRKVCFDEEGVLLRYKEYQEDYHYISYIYKKSMLDENNIVFPYYRRYQDPPFFVKAMIAAEVFWVSPVELYCIREDERSLYRKKTHIADALRGMIDVLECAVQNNLQKLHNLIVDRMNGEYDTAIMENAFENNFEVLDLLRRANDMIRWDWRIDSGKDKELFALRRLKDMRDMESYINAYEEIRNSHHLLIMWLNSHFNKTIESYLKKKNIRCIAIYGYGFFGEMLYKELCQSDICIKYVIDKRTNLELDVRVVLPQEEWQEVDAIIITPLAYQSIFDEWKDKFIYPKYVLKNILTELTEG